jgi:hypothetical protein
MAKYKLSEFEENRWHDSYGYVVYWDSERKVIDREMTWTTAAPPYASTEFLDPTPEVVEEAVKQFAKYVHRLSIRQKLRTHYEPSHHTHLPNGSMVVFKKAHNSRKAGIKIAKGATAKVISVHVDTFKTRSYSQFTYYNVTVDVGNNKWVSIPMEKLSLAGRPNLSMREEKAKALNSASHCQFRSMWYGGWDSKNWALEVLEGKKSVA